jgi:DNA replication protein DnaC
MTMNQTADVISVDLKKQLKQLRLGKLLDTLPERLALARQQKMPHQDFLLLLCSDEVNRRDSQRATLRAAQANLDSVMQLELWDDSAKVRFDRELLNELASLRFVEAKRHVCIVGPVGVGKTFIAHALGHVACRRGFSVFSERADKLFKALRQARLDNSYETMLRRLIAVDLLIIDDFGLDAMERQESRDAYELLFERHRSGSMIMTSNRHPDEWLSTFADPMRAQSALDRFKSNAFDFEIDGESYRDRQKPRFGTSQTKKGGKTKDE